MMRCLPVLLLVFLVRSTWAAEDASPSPQASPSVNTTPSILPSPEEKVLLEKLEHIKKTPPKDAAGESRARLEYIELLKEHASKFSTSPRAYWINSALVQLLVVSGKPEAADKAAQAFFRKASTPAEQFRATQLLVDLYTNTERTEKGIETIQKYLQGSTYLDGAVFFTYRLATLYADLNRYSAAISLLDDFLKTNPTSLEASRFRLRIIDLLLSANRVQDAINRLEGFSKQASDDEDKALSNYFLGIAYLALSRETSGAEAVEHRKKALSFEETLMTSARKSPRANEPYGAMAFSAAADIFLASGDKTGAIRIYDEMKGLFKGGREGAFAERAAIDTALVGSKIPDLSGPDLSGRTISLSSLTGKIVLVVPWSTWTEATVREVPALVKLEKTFVGKPFAILGVCLNRKEEGDAAQKLVKALKIDWPSLFDGKGSQNPLTTLLGNAPPPGNLIVDETGTIVRANLHGVHLKDVLSQEITRLERKTKVPSGSGK